MENKTISTKKYPVISYSVHGNGAPIVLLHGFPLDRSIWDEVAANLSENYRVIVPDIPGSGASTFEGEELSIEEMAESIKHILDNERIEKAVIAGHSMGGYVAVAFAELFPEMLAGFGFIHSFATPDNEEKKVQRRKSIELFKKGGKDPFIRQMIPGLFSQANKEACKSAIEQITQRALLTETKSMVAFYNAMINRPDRTTNLNNNKLPVLWVIGEDDTIAIKENLIQQSSLAYVNFVYTYDNCGHMSMIEKPGDLTRDIAVFAAYCFGK